MELPFPVRDYGLKFNGALRMRSNTLYNVYHHSAAGDKPAAQIHREHIVGRGWMGIAYNLYIRYDGTIELGRPIWAQGAHVGPEVNPVSVGTCLAGQLHLRPPTAAQMAAAGVVHAGLETIYPGIAVGLHSDFMATDCPGQYFDRRTFMSEIEKARAAIETQPAQPEPWKRVGLEWLVQAGLIEAGKWAPESAIDMGTLGVILSRLGFDVTLKRKEG